jgi:CTD small phosphatase-like protein 2
LKEHEFRHLSFAPTVEENKFRRHLILTYRGLSYARKCLKSPSMKFINSKLVNLIDSPEPRYKTLLFDLDETLVHTTHLKEHPDHILKATDNGVEFKVLIVDRTQREALLPVSLINIDLILRNIYIHCS